MFLPLGRLGTIFDSKEDVMTMNADQLRIAFGDLNGHRHVHIEFDNAQPCVIKCALLVPEEADAIIKLTDGTKEYLIDAQRVAWIEIG